MNDWLNISVFISSTFNDMHAERDLLVKRVFPELAEWCARRRIRLYDIDLRWGVTTEDAQSNNTVGVCLRNIDECRPFFLCFIGQRRGWVPGRNEVNEQTLENYPGMEPRIGSCSVTEMEIEHALLAPMVRLVNGELEKPLVADHALFFIRDEAYLADLSDSQRRVYTNASALDEEQADALHALFIERVREEWPGVYNYECRFDQGLLSPELVPLGGECAQGRLTDFVVEGRSLDSFVIEAFKEQILSAYPDRGVAASEDREGEDEAQGRRLDENLQGTVERVEVLSEFESYCIDPRGRPLYVHGAAGAGKSCLLSLFFAQHRGDYAFSAMRFCAISPTSMTWAGLWRDIDCMAGGDGLFSSDELSEQIPEVLRKVVAAGPSLLIIDGVDELSEGLTALASLPQALPDGLRLILSFRSGKMGADEATEHALQSGAATVYPIGPLADTREAKLIVNDYLEHFLKALDDDQISIICNKPAARNPLFLKVLLSELRVYGSYDQLETQIHAFGDSPRSAFAKLLDDLEHDIAYAAVPPAVFVPTICALLARARGMLHVDMLKRAIASLLDRPFEDIDDATAYYVRRLRPYLYFDGARVGFSYQTMREEALSRYCDHAKEEHLALARVLQVSNQLECLYHLRNAGAADDIGRLTGDFTFICKAIARSGSYAVWAELASCGSAANGEVLSCIGQVASIVGNDDSIAAALFYKELLPPLRAQAEAVCKAPWLRYDPIDIEPVREEAHEALEPTLIVEHSIVDYCLAPKARRAFLLEGESDIASCDLLTGERTSTFTLTTHGRIRRMCCSSDGTFLAIADESNTVGVYRVALTEGGRLLGCTLVHEDKCATVRFGGACLFVNAEGIVWQRPDGFVVEYETPSFGENIKPGERLIGCFGELRVWKGSSGWTVKGRGIEIVCTARVNDCIKHGEFIVVAIEDKKVLVCNAEDGHLIQEITLEESAVSLALHDGEIYGADRYGRLMKLTHDGEAVHLGRITEGDDIIDMSTQLISLGEAGLCFCSLHRLAILQSASGGGVARIARASWINGALSTIWCGRDSFYAVLANGRTHGVPYPSYMNVSANVNKLNTLKVACSGESFAYEAGDGIVRVEAGERAAEVGVNGPLCDLRYSPEAHRYWAVTMRAQLVSFTEDGAVDTRIDLPRSGSGIYTLCCCGASCAVISRRVQVWEDVGASAVIEDIVSFVEAGAIRWSRRLTQEGGRNVPQTMAFDATRDVLMLLYADHAERLSLDSGDTVASFSLTADAVSFRSGAALLPMEKGANSQSDESLLFCCTADGSDTSSSSLALSALSLATGERTALPSHRRVMGISAGEGFALVLEGNDRLFRVTLEHDKPSALDLLKLSLYGKEKG